MKLIQCYIENFGTLSNFKYDFQSGINIIKEKNGFGKTTLANFIKAMFYGLETKKNTKTLIDRKKYEPWQGGNFGGSVEFEINNKKYKLERFFKKKEADDVFKLYNLETNLESDDYTSNIGEEIFGINKEAFERSIFISGQNMQTNMNDSINAKLGNILESENDINSSEKAIKILDDAIKYYKKTGNRGAINEKIIEKTRLEHKLEEYKADEKILQELKDANKAISEQINERVDTQRELQSTISMISKEEVKKSKIQQYNLLSSNCNQSKQNLEAFKNKINDNSDLYKQIEENKNQIELLNNKNINLNKKISIKNKQKYISIVILALLIIMSVVLKILKLNTVFLVITLIMCIIPVFIFILIINNLKKIKEEILLNNNKIEKNTSIVATLIEIDKKQTNEQKIELDRLTREYNKNLNDIKSFEEENDMESLLSEEHNKSNSLTDFNKKELEEKLEKINKEINLLNDEKNYKKNKIESIESDIDIFEVENDIEVVSNEIEEMTKKLKIIEDTKKNLELAKESFSSHYLGKMENSFMKNIEAINGEKIDLNIDINLDVQISKYGGYKKIDFLSTGYKDLIYICMRMSLVEALFEGEKPFIVLDDPFVNLDEEKMEKAIELLKNIGKNYQIIYFVCHNSRNID